MKKEKYINDILKEELKCSIGCTEPSAIAFAVASSKAIINDDDIKSINLCLSSNMLKNALCVTIPNTDLSGIDIIVLLGLIKKCSKSKLQILSNITNSDLKKVNELRKKVKININLIENVDPLYIEVELKTNEHSSRTIVEKRHDNLKECYLDNVLIYSNESSEIEEKKTISLKYDEIYNFVISKKFDFDLMKKAKDHNVDIGEYGLDQSVGLVVGKGIIKMDLFNEKYKKIISTAVAGIDSRMSGIPKKVIINSGSGNQGIIATVPIVEFAKLNGISEEKELTALALSHLTTIYIRSKQSRLSSSCGIIIASAGVAAGIAYMLDCDKSQIENAIKNFLCSSFGVLCDGAKVTCSLKALSVVSSAINSALLAKNNICIDGNYGVVSKSFEDTIDSFSQIEKEITLKLDKSIMEIAVKNASSHFNC